MSSQRHAETIETIDCIAELFIEHYVITQTLEFNHIVERLKLNRLVTACIRPITEYTVYTAVDINGQFQFKSLQTSGKFQISVQGDARKTSSRKDKYLQTTRLSSVPDETNT